MADLLTLAERCEKATGPDRELDALIWLAVTPGATRKETSIPANETRRGWTIDETREPSGRLIIVPDYTASIDAAMTLVPEGAEWLRKSPEAMTVYFHPENDKVWATHHSASGAIPALALCAAALRARPDAQTPSRIDGLERSDV